MVGGRRNGTVVEGNGTMACMSAMHTMDGRILMGESAIALMFKPDELALALQKCKREQEDNDRHGRR